MNKYTLQTIALSLMLTGCQSQSNPSQAPAAKAHESAKTATTTTTTIVTIKPHHPGGMKEFPQSMCSASIVVNEDGNEKSFNFPIIAVNLYPDAIENKIKQGEITLMNRSKDINTKHILRVTPQETADGIAYKIEVIETKPQANQSLE